MPSAASSHFQDSKVVLNMNNERNKTWLHSAGLYDFVSLPWEHWKCNASAMQQFKFLQINNCFLTSKVALTVELVSHVFNLSMEGETKCDRAPVKAMEREFGVLDNPRGYYVIKKIKDADKKVQMEWYLENVLMLIKSDYMSDKNYAFLYAVEKGWKVAWDHIFFKNYCRKCGKQIVGRFTKHPD